MENVTAGRLARLVAVFASVLFAFALGVSLAGCGPSDEEAIHTAIDTELGALASPDDETYAKLVSNADSAGADLDQLGIDSTELAKSWLDGFSYEIGEVTVDGDTATAEVSVTCKQLYGILTDWSGGITDELASQNFASVDEIYAWAGQSMMAAIDAGQTTTTTISLALEKTDDGWALPESDANKQALVDAMLGDVSALSIG